MDKRNYGIDLLRLLLMFMVCILHTLGQGGVLNNAIVGTTSYKIHWFTEIISYCAVDSFALISGYMISKNKLKYKKIINMWFQVFFYSFIISFIIKIINMNIPIGKNELISYMFPILNNIFWYMSAYFGLFIISPILNNYLLKVKKDTAKKYFVSLFIIFSLLAYTKDPFKTTAGYSMIWLVILYCLGALANKTELFKLKKTSTLLIMYFISSITTWFIYMCFNNDKLISYISPLILLNGMILVIIFSRLKLKGKIISKLSPLALGIYLFQLNPIIWNIYLKDRFIFILNYNIFIEIALVFLFATLIFISGLVVEYIRIKLFELVKIEKLSDKIVECLSKIINKLSLLLN